MSLCGTPPVFTGAFIKGCHWTFGWDYLWRNIICFYFQIYFNPFCFKIVMSQKVPTWDVFYALCNSKILIGYYCFVCNFDCIKFTPITPKILWNATMKVCVQYSVDSIKHTVLLRILLQIFLLVSIKSTVHWKFSRQINFAYCLY